MKNTNSNKLKNFILELNFNNPFSIIKMEFIIFCCKNIEFSRYKLSLDNNVVGFINCAINKNLISNKGLELLNFLSNKCKLKKNGAVMMIIIKSFQ